MKLAGYCEDRPSAGILSTSDANGNVDAAIYSHPRFLQDDHQTLCWIIASHESHENPQSPPRSCFLVVEEGPGYHGEKLYLKRSANRRKPVTFGPHAGLPCLSRVKTKAQSSFSYTSRSSIIANLSAMFPKALKDR